MGGQDDGARDRRGAAATLAAILLGTMVAFGPGGIHGTSYWSSPPIVELRAAEIDGPGSPGVDAVGAEAGAVRGEVGTPELVDATEPRLPLGEEPLPALPYGVQERLRDAWNAAPVEEAPAGEVPADLPPIGVAELPPGGLEGQEQGPGETPADATGAGAEGPDAAEDATLPELVGAAPASEAEVATTLARQAGAEAARAFVAEMNVLLGRDTAQTQPADAAQPEEVAGELVGESVADELSRQDVWQQEAAAQRSAQDEQREMAMREQERVQAAAMTAWAVQQALTPFFTTVPQAVAPGATTPMQTTPTAGVGTPTLPGAATGVPGTAGGLVPSAGGLGLGAGGLTPATPGTAGGPTVPGALQPFPTGATAPGATTLDGAGMGGMGAAGAPLGGGLLVPPGGMMVPGTGLVPGGGMAPVGSPMTPLP